MTEIKCPFCKGERECPLNDVIEAGNSLSDDIYWCGDYKQQAECGNEVHEKKARPISHRAEHSANFHKRDGIERTTSLGSIETAQSAEKVIEFNERQKKLRRLVQKYGPIN